MKRMVKNGDLIDVEPDGTITVAGKPIGGGENERELKLIMPYDSSDSSSDKKLNIDDEIWNNINNCYYETIKLFYNDGNPIGVFNVFNFTDNGNYISNNKNYTCISIKKDTPPTSQTWYGVANTIYTFVYIRTYSSGAKKYLYLSQYNVFSVPNLIQSKFDALYKLADKPTQDGTYVLKATVSGGAVTYTWVAQ